MPDWIVRYLSEPANRTALYRGLIALVGYATAQGWLPQALSDLIYSVTNDPALMGAAIALLMPAGQRNLVRS